MRNAVLAVTILISLIIGASTLTRGHQWGDDFAWYIVQAKSVLDGTTDEFMVQSAFTNQQSTTHLGPLAYPWGYPLILAPVYAVKGISPLALKLPGLFFYAGFLVCLYLLMKSRLTEIESLLIVSLFAFNPLLLQFLDQILSDIPFLFFSTLSLLLMTRENKENILDYIGIGAAIFFTTFLRVTGVLLLGCFLVVEFFRFLNHRKDRTTAIQTIKGSLIVCFVFVLLWITNLLLFPSGGESYFSQYAGLIETAKTFLPGYFNVFSFFFGDTQAWKYLYYLLFPFFLLGVWHRWKHELTLVLFFVLWMLVHITYPYWQGPRYIFPLLPIFIYFVFQGTRFFMERLPESYRLTGQWVFYGFWILIAGIFLMRSSMNAYANLQNNRAINGPFDPYSTEIYDYIKGQTPSESVVVFFKPRVMVMMTGHPAIMSMECERILKGDYLVLSRKVGENQQIPPEEIDSCNLPLSQVLKNNRFVVYEIHK
ncbi:MAG TPA: glycosyltransferase family 39 protein [Anaerolineales bacterium]|nr:glycosyltransferase family 39 protein [Anaerolineales bacterium]